MFKTIRRCLLLIVALLVSSVITLPVYANNTSTMDETQSYSGRLSVRLVEPNGDVFIAHCDCEYFKTKAMAYFRQYSGQAVSVSSNQMQVDASREKKYHWVFQIEKQVEETFFGLLKLYKNQLETQSDRSVSLVSKKIAEHKVKGYLNKDTSYQFIDDDKPNLYFKVSIDKVFGQAEIKERLVAIKAKEK